MHDLCELQSWNCQAMKHPWLQLTMRHRDFGMLDGIFRDCSMRMVSHQDIRPLPQAMCNGSVAHVEQLDNALATHSLLCG